MPYLTLANPAKRKKKSKRSAAQKRATKKLLALNRAKAAVKAAPATKKKSKRKNKSSNRKSQTKSASMAKNKSRKRSKRSKSKKPTSKKPTRRPSRPGGGSVLSQIKGAFSKDNLVMAGGVVAGNIATNYLLKMDWAKKLPGMDGTAKETARTVYSTLIPVAVAAVTYRYSRPLAQGMVVGALSNAIIGLVKANTDSVPPDVSANINPPALTAGTSGMRGMHMRGLRNLPIAMAGTRGLRAYPNGKTSLAGLRNVYASPSPFNKDAFAKS